MLRPCYVATPKGIGNTRGYPRVVAKIYRPFFLITRSQMSESKYWGLFQLCSFSSRLASWSRSYSTCSRHSRSGGRVGPTTPRRRNSLFGAPRSPADAPSGGTVSPAASEKSATSTWLGYGVRLRDRIRDRVRDRVRVRPPRRRARPVPSREARDPCRPSVACLQ